MSNHLTPIALDLVHQLHDERKAHQATREVLYVAMEMLGTYERRYERARESGSFLRAQLRAATSGRTIAEERQRVDEEDTLTNLLDLPEVA